MPEVVRVIPNNIYKLQTTRSWDYLGLSASASDSDSNLLQDSHMGDGVIVGLFDTGVWPESRAFSDEGLGPIPDRWNGTCVTGQEFNASNCNKKLIGAKYFARGIQAEYGEFNTSGGEEYMSPRDANGHGTHTSSTATGSFVANVSYKGLARGMLRGGAPRARLAVYKVCWNVGGGQCASADMLKAFDEAIHDGVDVLSLSIGGSLPVFAEVDERDGIATGSYHAVAKGITVVCAAGNAGPAAYNVQNTAPWILTVAASTVDRMFYTPITLGNNKTYSGEAFYVGKTVGFSSFVYPEGTDLEPTANSLCENLHINKTLASGKVVLCFTSSVSRSAAARAALAVTEAGGVGVIVAKSKVGTLAACANDFPCIEVDYEVGTQMLFYIRSTEAPVVKLSPSRTVVGKPVAARVAYFSARGPNSIEPAVLKPDVAAPGVSILAAITPSSFVGDKGFAMISGTSMATPHVTGIVALIKAIHPSWSPAAIKSAIVTTAQVTGPSGIPIFADGSPRKLADPFDFGGGIINPNGAADPGLVYDMNTEDYIYYLCSVSYTNLAVRQLTGQRAACPSKKSSILNLNQPSITIPHLTNTTTLTRTVTNVGAAYSKYIAEVEAPVGVKVRVRPNVLRFKPSKQKLSFTVTVTSTHKMNTDFLFGSLKWRNAKYSVRIPMAVRTEYLDSFFETQVKDEF
ncbi:hypothetical protein QQ045_020900 [Rhodiola kirilowii]